MVKRVSLISALIICAFFPSRSAGSGRDLQHTELGQFIYVGDDSRYVEQAESAIAFTSSRLLSLLGDSLAYKPSVYFVNDMTRVGLPTEVVVPDWGAGFAFPQQKMIVILSADKSASRWTFEELMGHEYAHLVIAQKSGYRDVPRWFNEGLAMYVSNEWSWSDNLAMSKAAVFGDLVYLREIESLNAFGEDKAAVAYAESYLAVRHLVDYYGENSLGSFLGFIALGYSIDETLRKVTGSDYREFENEFRQELDKRYNILSLFMDTIFFWLALAIIMVIGGFLHMRRRREYYRKWDEQERLQSTDFTYGDPDDPERIDDEDEAWRS